MSWQHQLSDAAQTYLTFYYGAQKVPSFTPVSSANDTETFLGALATYRYNFTPSLSGYAQYAHFERNSDVPGRAFTQNVALIGLSKAF